MATVGDLLAGRYELRSRLGRGGMAEVFRAFDTRLGREVAVKVLADQMLSDPRSVERFEREGRTAASLHHPNVVDVYDAASEDDVHYLVMELVEGPTLADVIKREGQMPVARALDIAGRIATALEVAHERGLVHHDVKPSNVLFDDDGAVKVADFGIARAASSDITTVQGSPPYVAPEQARGGRADPRSDVYGLGCVLFEMLAGRPPFSGDSASSVIMKHLETPPPPLSEFRDDVPSAVDDVVMRALAKDPEQRQPSAHALRAELDRVARGLPANDGTIASTRHLDSDRTVAVGGAAAAADRTIRSDPNRVHTPPRDATRALTDDLDADDDEPPAPRRRVGPPTMQAVTVVTLVVLLLVVGYLAINDERVTQPLEDTAQDDTAEVEPEQPDEPAAEEPADDEPAQPDGGDGGSSVGGVADRIRDLLDRGRQADEATSQAIEELQQELEDAVERNQQGDDQGAADRIAELRERINDLSENNEIGSGLADRLRELVDRVRPFQE